jgi:hypothetical protein
VFRGKYLDALAQVHQGGELHFGCSSVPLVDTAAFRRFPAKLAAALKNDV